MRELATRDLLDESIVAQTMGDVSARTTVGLAEINSFFEDY